MEVIQAALASYLDLLLLAGDPWFVWGPDELRAAFQWACTLQQLVDTPEGAAAVQQRMQVLRPKLPRTLQLLDLSSLPQQPLCLALEHLLRRPAGLTAAVDHTAESWLQAVLAAYMAVVVLPSPPAQQAAAEEQLLATLAGLQQQAAAQGILHAAAQQAAQAAAARLRLGSSLGCSQPSSSDGHSSSSSGGQQPITPPPDHASLLAEALLHMTSPECLQAAAAAALLVERVEGDPAAQQDGAAQAQPEGGAPQPPPSLAGLLQELPLPLKLELLCVVALLPGWDSMLQRLAGFSLVEGPAHASSSSSASGSAGAGGGRGDEAARQAVQLLCGACVDSAADVLALHPALLAEVCRHSFRFLACFAPLLAEHVRRADQGTARAAQAARWRAAHCTKHADHVTDYLLAKGCLPAFDAAAAASAGAIL